MSLTRNQMYFTLYKYMYRLFYNKNTAPILTFVLLSSTFMIYHKNWLFPQQINRLQLQYFQWLGSISHKALPSKQFLKLIFSPLYEITSSWIVQGPPWTIPPGTDRSEGLLDFICILPHQSHSFWHNIGDIIPRMSVQSLLQSFLVQEMTNKSHATTKYK